MLEYFNPKRKVYKGNSLDASKWFNTVLVVMILGRIEDKTLQ